MFEPASHTKLHFVSDLHLSESTPLTLQAFESWLASVSQRDDAIFLLGDIFEVWVGDDHRSEVNDRVQTALLASAAAGTQLYCLQGNRDFLLGEAYCESASIELLPDPEFISVAGHIILITHGDQLCTDDVAYQKFRAMSRTEKWMNDFLGKPLEERIAYARMAREESAKHKASKSLDIMDVNLEAVRQAFTGKWPDGTFLGRSDILLHGHTHRCAVHGDSEPGLINETHAGSLSKGQRLVLPDWDFDSPDRTYPRGGFLTIHSDGQFELSLMR